MNANKLSPMAEAYKDGFELGMRAGRMVTATQYMLESEVNGFILRVPSMFIRYIEQVLKDYGRDYVMHWEHSDKSESKYVIRVQPLEDDGKSKGAKLLPKSPTDSSSMR